MEKQKDKKQIVIIGGGFGGIKAALELAGHPAYEVTLISDQPNFRYYPTLYYAALGKSRLGSIIPLSEIFDGKKVKIVNATAQTIDRGTKEVKDKNGNSYPYDYLVVALGVVTNYFGIKGLEEFSFGIKTLEEAQELRDHLHKQLSDEKKPDLNYVIIGGGPTGVELAGSLPGYLKHIMKNHGIEPREIHVDLVEALPKLVPRMPEAYSQAVQKRLQKLGVELYLGQTVQAETADDLQLGGHSIQSHTVVWTAGVTNHPFLKANNFALNDHGKAKVDPTLQAEPGIYVIGDNADTQYSGMAQTALFDGQYLAGNLKRLAEGQQPKPYKAKKPIYVIPAGPQWAAVLWNKVQVYGRGGWMLREAADLRGFKDYEPWWKASKHFLANEAAEESCPVCAAAAS